MRRILDEMPVEIGCSVLPPYRTTLAERHLCGMNGFPRKAETLLILASLLHRRACRHQLLDDLRLSLFLQIGILFSPEAATDQDISTVRGIERRRSVVHHDGISSTGIFVPMPPSCAFASSSPLGEADAGQVGRSTASSLAAARNRKNRCVRHPCRVRLTRPALGEGMVATGKGSSGGSPDFHKLVRTLRSWPDMERIARQREFRSPGLQCKNSFRGAKAARCI